MLRNICSAIYVPVSCVQSLLEKRIALKGHNIIAGGEAPGTKRAQSKALKGRNNNLGIR